MFEVSEVSSEVPHNRDIGSADQLTTSLSHNRIADASQLSPIQIEARAAHLYGVAELAAPREGRRALRNARTLEVRLGKAEDSLLLAIGRRLDQFRDIIERVRS